MDGVTYVFPENGMILILSIDGKTPFASFEPAGKERTAVVPTARMLAKISPNRTHISQLGCGSQ